MKSPDPEELLEDFAPSELDQLLLAGENSGQPVAAESVFAEIRALSDARRQRANNTEAGLL